MPLSRIAIAVTLPLAIACAAGVEDPQEAQQSTAPSTTAEADRPIVPAHEIEGKPVASAEPPDLRSSVDQRPNARAVIGWDFEAASADCNGWTASGATAIRGIPSHSGAYACKLCADGSSTEMKLTRRLAGLPRGEWVVSAWLRRLRTSNADVAARVTVDEATDRAGITSSILLIDEWRLLGDPLELPSEVVSTSLSIVATAAAGECILVDDVLVESATADAVHSPPPTTPTAFVRQ